MKILVAYDGSMHAKSALRYGIGKVRDKGGELLAVHVFNSGLFIDYNAGPWALETAKKESAKLSEEARNIIAEAGGSVRARVVELDGHPEEETLSFAAEKGVDLIIATPKQKAMLRKAPCPVSIVPGTILVPVDNTESYLTSLETVQKEAAATGSEVILLGVVPEHLFSNSERSLVEKIRKETENVLKDAKKAFREKGLEVEGVLRSGYPDEEILKVAEQNLITMIIVPESGDQKSELAKAASIILDEPGKYKNPLVLVPAQGGD